MSGAASFTTGTKKRDLEQKHLATLAFWDTEGWLGTVPLPLGSHSLFCDWIPPWQDCCAQAVGNLAVFGDGLCPLLRGAEPLEGFCRSPQRRGLYLQVCGCPYLHAVPHTVCSWQGVEVDV